MNVQLLDQLADLAEQHRALLLTVGGAALLLLTAAAWWARRRGNRGAAYRWAAGAVAVALSAEGMWEVATESLGFAWWKALLLFAFAELAMLNEAHQAKARVSAEREPGVHGVAVWVIAVGAGLIAASNAANTAEYLLRLGAPTLLAWQWWSDLIADRPDRERQPSRWVWTPQRIGVRLGLLKPGGLDDLGAVFRQRNVERMVRLADRIDTGSERLADRRALRLRRLAQSATPEMLAEVGERYRRGLDVTAVIFGGGEPSAEEPAPVDSWDYSVPIGPMPAPVASPGTPDDVTSPAKPRAPRPRPRSLTSAEKVARAAAKLPAGTVAQIAAKAGVSESTARRYLPPATAPVAAETTTARPVNGTPVELMETTR
ncbi:hypothetical protein [Micromonospora sp. PLK6-60]|uniref:hypothetical protein n=1 Tax=Micromonospora sp. PLK6-60 TaxID=2873383 RepID=UPI0021077F96|nr:hypothetical protein [Micromonospora sp. PLK6-60]